MEGLQITVTNYSDKSWQRTKWEVGAGSSNETNWPDEVTQTPAQTIEPRDGQTVAAAHSEHLTFIVKDALYMTLGYKSDIGEFAITAQQLFHMFGIGKQCEWSYMDPNSKKWSDSTTDTSPKEWQVGQYTIRATPSLDNTSASVDVLIKNSH